MGKKFAKPVKIQTRENNENSDLCMYLYSFGKGGYPSSHIQ